MGWEVVFLGAVKLTLHQLFDLEKILVLKCATSSLFNRWMGFML